MKEGADGLCDCFLGKEGGLCVDCVRWREEKRGNGGWNLMKEDYLGE